MSRSNITQSLIEELEIITDNIEETCVIAKKEITRISLSRLQRGGCDYRPTQGFDLHQLTEYTSLDSRGHPGISLVDYLKMAKGNYHTSLWKWG